MTRKSTEPDLSTLRGRFGANLRRLREKKFPAQEAIAEALTARGLLASRATVSRWEHGVRVPDLDDWPTIAEVLGCKLLPRGDSPDRDDVPRADWD
jgi:transcriptional regulator with XRE-family HTH domain